MRILGVWYSIGLEGTDLWFAAHIDNIRNTPE